MDIQCGKISMEIVGDSMKTDTFHGHFIIKLIWKLFGDLIYHAVSLGTPDKLHKF